jgi:hypothetical protein
MRLQYFHKTYINTTFGPSADVKPTQNDLVHAIPWHQRDQIGGILPFGYFLFNQFSPKKQIWWYFEVLNVF